jgi:hypothetical protein
MIEGEETLIIELPPPKRMAPRAVLERLSAAPDEQHSAWGARQAQTKILYSSAQLAARPALLNSRAWKKAEPEAPS